jgi:hypothetical protein
VTWLAQAARYATATQQTLASPPPCAQVTMADICESVWEALMEKPRAEVRETLTAQEVLQHLMGAKKVSSPFELCVTIGPVGFIIKQVRSHPSSQSVIPTLALLLAICELSVSSSSRCARVPSHNL